MSACSDIAPNYYLDGSLCKPCNSLCATCTGPEEYVCTSCEASAIDYVDSTVKNPKHCTNQCGTSRYHDTANKKCYDCAADCHTCGGTAVADCTYCMSGYFLQPTTKACLTTCVSPLFANAVTRTCDPCDSSCTTCVTSATNCNACASQHFPNSGSFPTSCGTCDTACNECTAAGNTNCQACATNYYPVDQLPNKCVATCTDHANNFYLDGALCKECASECGTCSGPLNSNCYSCAVSHYEIVGHSSASPMHCLNSCPLFYFDQGWQCKCKSLTLTSACLANCEVCDDAATCTTCESGYFYLGTACINPCPSQRYYPNSSTRVCESCSDSHCLDCRPVDKDTCF